MKGIRVKIHLASGKILESNVEGDIHFEMFLRQLAESNFYMFKNGAINPKHVEFVEYLGSLDGRTSG